MRPSRLAAIVAMLSLLMASLGTGSAAAAPSLAESVNTSLCSNGGNLTLDHDGLLPAYVCFNDVDNVLVIENIAPYWLKLGNPSSLKLKTKRFVSTPAFDQLFAEQLSQSHIPPGARYTFSVTNRSSAIYVSMLLHEDAMNYRAVYDGVTTLFSLNSAKAVTATLALVDFNTGRLSWEEALGVLGGIGVDALAHGGKTFWQGWLAGLVINLGEQLSKNVAWIDALDKYDSGLLIIHPAPSRYRNYIVQWSGDTKSQKTSWVVSGHKKRYWVPDSTTYNCLKDGGFAGPASLRARMLDQLPDQDGVWVACGQDRLKRSRIMLRNTVLKSGDGRYKLKLQSDGNLVFRGPNGVIWANNKVSNYLVVQSDGNLVTRKFDGTATWASGTAGSGANRLVVQNDGNLVLYSPDRAVWTYRGRIR